MENKPIMSSDLEFGPKETMVRAQVVLSSHDVIPNNTELTGEVVQKIKKDFLERLKVEDQEKKIAQIKPQVIESVKAPEEVADAGDSDDEIEALIQPKKAKGKK